MRGSKALLYVMAILDGAREEPRDMLFMRNRLCYRHG